MLQTRKSPIETDWWVSKSLIPFEPCSSMCVTGPTGSGKTQWVYRLLKNLNGMYVNNAPKKTMYCYGVYQDLFEDMEKMGIIMHPGLPSDKTIEEFADGQHGLIILDDLMARVVAEKSMELLFTQGCHHKQLSVIFITQNLFAQGKTARTVALNTWYLVLFKNVRDASQIMHLGRQIFPRRVGALVEAYEDVMKIPYNYLVVDMSPCSDDRLRLRTRIFPNEDPIIYQPLV